MQSLDVYQYINALARRSRGDLSHRHDDAVSFNRTFKGDNVDIHVFASHEECLQILKDSGFIQPKIADAIAEIFKSLGVNVKPIEEFLRNNLIDMNGARHAAAKPSFVRDYGAAQRRLAAELPLLCRKAFKDFINGNESHIGAGLVEPYVDSVMEFIFEGVGRKNWAGQASCIFEYVHSATKLKRKAVQVTRLGRILGSKSENGDGGRVGSVVVPLTYVLQGRDPLIGALSSYMHSLVSMNEDERHSCVQATTARDLFWQVSPVNYIGRLATKKGVVGGISIKPGDQIILLLPFANHDKVSLPKNSLAFGAGAHICPGQALAIAIGDAWLNELRSQYARISWNEIKPDRPVTAVFRQYRTHNSKHAHNQ